MNRFEATRFLVQRLGDEAVVANLGTNSIDLHNAADRPQNLYLRGGMGLTASIGLGVALAQPQRKVFVLDGDGSLLMNMGVLATIADQAPANLVHIVFDNEQWGETGHQPSHTARVTDLAAVAQGAGIRKVKLVRELEDFQQALLQALQEDGPWCIVAKVEETGRSRRPAMASGEVNVARFRQSMQ